MNRDPARRARWWLFGRSNEQLRRSLFGLPRYIATLETSKFKPFVFVEPDVVPDHKLYAITLDDAFFLGVLSSRIHQVWALAAGGTLEDRPTWTNTTCFLPFPFPACDEAAKTRIRALGEELDAHRKRVQAQHPGLSLTAMYNVLEALREDRALTRKEQAVHDAGLVSVLRQLHDELDAAVAAAYGWEDLWHWLAEAHRGTLHDFKTGNDCQLTATESGFHAAITAWEREFDGEILVRLVALNAARSAEEAAGTIRWLRPEYQAPASATMQGALDITTKGALDTKAKTKASKAKTPWPKSLAERVRATELALQSSPSPITPAELAKRFSRAKPEDLSEILETLTTLGRAHREGDAFSI